MTLPALVDFNVLLPLLLPQHMAHRAASQWLAAQPAGTARYALPVQLGVLRLLSQPRIMGSAALLPKQALKTWDELVDATGMLELIAPQPAHAHAMRRFIARRAMSPNLWTNAWLAALAASIDCEMVTFDAGFRSYAGLRLNLLQT